jgi:hypothetical protein
VDWPISTGQQKHKKKKHVNTYPCRFKPTNLTFEWSKTLRASDNAACVYYSILRYEECCKHKITGGNGTGICIRVPVKGKFYYTDSNQECKPVRNFQCIKWELYFINWAETHGLGGSLHDTFISCISWKVRTKTGKYSEWMWKQEASKSERRTEYSPIKP